MPAYVGIDRARLKWLVTNNILTAKMRAQNRPHRHVVVPSARAMAEMVEELEDKEWTLCLHTRVQLNRNCTGLQFHADPTRGRFDFVEECLEDIWTYDDSKDPCRPVVQLRGFLRASTVEPIVFADGTRHYSFGLAVARNLVPHKESSVLASGDPVHSGFPLLHNLWEYMRPVWNWASMS